MLLGRCVTCVRAVTAQVIPYLDEALFTLLDVRRVHQS
jgi:hypothetical protein